MTDPAGPARRATLKDVAALAGVSVATASKALNARTDVSPQTRIHVIDAAERLAFAPNLGARGLRSGSTRTIGLLTNDMGGRFSFPVMLGVESAVGGRDMSVLLCDSRGDLIREQHYLRVLQSRQVDGVIVVGENSNPRPSLTASIEMPIVYAYAPSEDPRDASFSPDDLAGATLATEHLIGLGRRRIAHITGPRMWRATNDRVQGFGDALRRAALEPAHPILYGDWSQRWGRRAAEMLITSGAQFDAVFCGSDQIATGVLDTLHDAGISVPHNVAVVGYDNWDVFAEESRPPLTTVDMNLQQLGTISVEALLQALNGQPPAGHQQIQCRIVIRESTASHNTNGDQPRGRW